jgi:hypothetical protein
MQVTKRLTADQIKASLLNFKIYEMDTGHAGLPAKVPEISR